MLLADYGCPMGQKALSDGEQVYMPNMAKIWQKTAKKNTQNWPKIIKAAPILANGGCFSIVLARASHLKGL